MESTLCKSPVIDKSDGVPIMDVNKGELRPTRSPRSTSAALLSDPERVRPKTMTESPSYETALPLKSAGIDADTAAVFYDRVVAAGAV